MKETENINKLNISHTPIFNYSHSMIYMRSMLYNANIQFTIRECFDKLDRSSHDKLIVYINNELEIQLYSMLFMEASKMDFKEK